MNSNNSPASIVKSALTPDAHAHSGRVQPFLNPILEPNNIDLFVARSTILNAVKEALPYFKGTFLDIGCGIMPYKELITSKPSNVSKYIGLDLEDSEIYQADVDLRWDGKNIPLADATIDSAMATEVLEHCPDPLAILKEARRVLKPGGVFFFTVPFIWPLHDTPNDFFRYTPFALEKLLKEAGFNSVDLRAMSGWNASLAQMMGLWLKRSPLQAAERRQWALKLWPIYLDLVNSDQPPVDSKAGNTMTTGWTGIAHIPGTTLARTPQLEVEPTDLPVIIVRALDHNYSETFLEDHVNLISRKTTVLYGYPFPRFVAGRSILPENLENQLQSSWANGHTSPDQWRDYTAALAKFFASTGARVALVETGLMGVFVYTACEQAALPYVVHFHGLDAYGRELLERWKNHYQAFFKTAAQIIVVSQAMRDQLLDLGAPAERVILAPYGVAVEVARAAEPVKAGPTFLAVGSFVDKKAPLVTLTAFGAIRDQVPNAHLIMIGEGPLLKSCREWTIKHNLEGAVTFAGMKSREAVSNQMACSGIFVQHSVTAANGDREGLPLAVLEAGAHGLPVVSTSHAGIPDAVRDGIDGYLVAEHDVEGMAQAMLRLAQNPALAAKLGASFRKRVRQQYSRKASIERLQGILIAAAEGHSIGQDMPKNADSAQALKAIATDRNNHTAYLEFAKIKLKEGDVALAYCAIGELHRIFENKTDTLDILKSIESRDLLENPAVTIYRERAGWVPKRMAKRPLRVLVVTNLLPPQEMGGYGRTMWEFSRELTERGHTVQVMTADLPQLMRKPTREHEAFENHVQRSLSLYGDWKNGVVAIEPNIAKRQEIVRANHKLIMSTAKIFGPDIVMVGNIDFLGHFFIQEILNQNIPVIHRLGNETPGFEPSAAPKSSHYCLAGCSEWVNENLRKKGYPFTHYEILPPGSPLTDYYRAFPPQRAKLKIAFASLLMPYKGAHILIEALGHLEKLGIPFECTLAGDTTSKEYIDKLNYFAKKHGFISRINFTGFLAKRELSELYAKSNVLVFPSIFNEPFGKTQIEAMAAGLLVISSGNGGSRDIIRDGETGMFFQNNKWEDLAEKLITAHQKPEQAARIAAKGQAEAFKYTTGASVDKLEIILSKMASDRRNADRYKSSQ